MRLSEIAELLGVKAPEGADEVEIKGISTLEEATSDELSFLTGAKYMDAAKDSQAAFILVPEKMDAFTDKALRVPHVWSAVLKLLQEFFPENLRHHYKGIHPTAVVHPDACIDPTAHIGPNAVVAAGCKIGGDTYLGPGVVIGESVEIGGGCTLHANSVVEAGCKLGDGVILQPGAVIGADGFKYEMIRGKWTRIPQVGGVTLRNDVEVGANSCIDRASYTQTLVKDNTKIDNLVQVAHNAEVGSNCIIVSQTGIAGSSTLGDNCILAAQSGVADNIVVGDNVTLMVKTGVTRSVEPGQVMFGHIARPFPQEARVMAATAKLPKMAQDVARMKKQMVELQAEIAKLQNG